MQVARLDNFRFCMICYNCVEMFQIQKGQKFHNRVIIGLAIENSNEFEEKIDCNFELDCIWSCGFMTRNTGAMKDMLHVSTGHHDEEMKCATHELAKLRV